MNLAEFGINIVENLVASIPQLAVVGSSLVLALKKITTKTEEFPSILKNTKEKLDDSFDNTTKQIAKSLEETKEAIALKVNGSLEGMQTELNSYKEQLTQQKEQSNMLVKQNKLFMEVILEFVAENPKLIQEGISRAVSLKTQLTKQELEQYPNVLVNDSQKLVQALSEASKVMGKEEFDKMLVGLGYERKDL